MAISLLAEILSLFNFEDWMSLISPEFASGGSGKNTVQLPSACCSTSIPNLQSSFSPISTDFQPTSVSPMASVAVDLTMVSPK